MCQHYFPEEKKHRAGQKTHPFYEYCAAYPDGGGIPLPVLLGGHFHARDGDSGIRFLPKKDEPPSVIEFYREVVCAEEDDEPDD
jgi:hypothetical protein